MTTKRYDVILVGSGIASLTCAALLAKKGRSVCVLERYLKPGGYLHGFRRHGHHYDTGAHYLGAMSEGQPFRQLMEYLGVYDDSLFVPMDREAFDVMAFPDRTVEFPHGYEALAASLKREFPTEATAIDAYLAKIQNAVTHFQTYRYRPKVDQAELLRCVETTLATVVDSLTKNDELKAVLYAHCLLHGVRPEDVAFGMHAIMTDSFVTGAVGLAKGGDALAEKYVEVIRKHGGEVHMRKPVVRLVNVGDEIRAVETADGERYEGDWVVSGIHPARAFALLSEPGILRPVFRERLASAKESVASFGVYASCRGPIPVHPRRNYFFFAKGGTDGLFNVSDRPEAPPVVFMNSADRLGSSDATDRALKLLAPGPYAWFRKWEGTRVGHRGADYDDLKSTYANLMWDLVDRYMPGVKASRLEEVTSSPLSNLHFNNAPEGSGYGLYHSIAFTGPRALGPRTRLKNFLITGQSTLFPGFLGAATAAVRTAGHLLGTKDLLAEIQGVDA